VEESVNYNWGSDSPYEEAGTSDEWSARWEGLVRAQFSETYTFQATVAEADEREFCVCVCVHFGLGWVACVWECVCVSLEGGGGIQFYQLFYTLPPQETHTGVFHSVGLFLLASICR